MCGVCVIVTYYTLDSVLLAFGLTCIMACALTAYAMKSEKDFSAWGAGYVGDVNYVLSVESWLKLHMLNPFNSRINALHGGLFILHPCGNCYCRSSVNSLQR